VADSRPNPAPPAGDGERFTPQVAERIIRRAVRLHERTADALSLDEVRQTLSAIGVAPEAAERAAAEVRGELQRVWRIRGPGQVLLHVVAIFLMAVFPGLALVLFYRDIPLLPPWLALPLGLWFLFVAVRWQVRELARMWRNRHLTDAVPE
jgi:hypothetical protein